VRLRRTTGRKPARARSGKMTKPKRNETSNAARRTSSSVADLQNQVGVLTRELAETREQQTATANVVKVIMYNGQNYAGNIRLDASDRDQGRVHFAYFEDMQEYRTDSPMQYPARPDSWREGGEGR